MPRLSTSSISMVLMVIIAPLLVGCAVDPMEQLSQQVELPDETAKQQAILTLAGLRDSRAVDALIDVLQSDEQMYDQAAVALVKQGRAVQKSRKTNPVTEKVGEVVGKGYVGEKFRARAAWVLGEIGDRQTIEVLTAAAGYGPGFSLVVEQANKALDKLGYTSEGRPYEISQGALAGQVQVLPAIEPLPEIEAG